MNKLLLSTYLAITFLLSACGGSSGNAKPAPEPIPAPVISSFTTSTSSIMAGEAANLTAVFSNGNGTIDTSVGSINSGESKAVLPNNTTTYTLTVENSVGVKVSSSVTIETVPLLITNIRPYSTDDKLSFWLTVSSQLDIVEVVAEIADRSTVVRIYSPRENIYYGRISVADLTDGEYPLTITGKDNLGRTNSVIKQVIIDKLPVIDIKTPLEHLLYTPLLPLDINCKDNLGDCEITVKHSDTILASATNQLNQTIDLSAFSNEKVTLDIEGKDSKGQVAIKSISLFINASTADITLLKAFSGDVLDFDGQRALIKEELTSNGLDVNELHIAELTTDNIESIDVPGLYRVKTSGAYLSVRGNYLTPRGAVFETEYNTSFDWNNNELYPLGSTSPVQTAGDYAVFCKDDILYRRTLSTQINTIIDTDPRCTYDITNNGTIVASAIGYRDIRDTPGILLYKNDQPTLITNSGEQPVINKTGTAFLSVKIMHTAIGERYQMILHDSDNVLFESESALYGYGGQRDTDHPGKIKYKINNNWIIYASPVNFVSRSPSGEIKQRTSFTYDGRYGSPSLSLEALADNGDVMFSFGNKRYFSKADGQLTTLGASVGKSMYINDTWYLVVNNAIYTFTPAP
ncbi:hypothetical protein [Colwellia sp. UCD-KL20]|uniref:hypothetical protein n=1 Tax=Colwellia sp. UCD-KL20 TaxID=1917165 RepID=UPI00097113F8|nr:hypothetical protein [Colwellia sp. UCD-KL20]